MFEILLKMFTVKLSRSRYGINKKKKVLASPLPVKTKLYTTNFALALFLYNKYFKTLTQIVPHGPDLKAGLAPHVLVAMYNFGALVGREVLELQRALREEGDGAAEEIVPELLLKGITELLLDGVRE